MIIIYLLNENPSNYITQERILCEVNLKLLKCSGGVVADIQRQLHNPVKHCGLSSRRSRVQIPAGALL
jgi:hypothetical protein